MKKLILVTLLCFIMTGCGPVRRLAIDTTITKYNSTAPKIRLGDSKEDVLAILLPTQRGLPAGEGKAPESFRRDDKTIEIYYFRTRHHRYRLTTDDEFTPYVFTDGILTSIGWISLGGSQSRGRM